MKYGTTDRCTGGTPTADSQYDVNYPPSHTFDSNDATWWNSGVTLPHWIKYDFGAAVSWKISKVTIKSGQAAQNAISPKTFTIEGSNNDSDFDVLDTQTNLDNWSALETRTFTFTNKINYRYIKINITVTEQGSYAGANEIDMFEGIYVAGGFSGGQPWIFMKDMWEKHNKLWIPKLILPKDLGFSY